MRGAAKSPCGWRWRGGRRWLALAAAILLSPAQPGAAQAPLDDVLKGFEDGPARPAAEDRDRGAVLPSWLKLGGSIAQDASYSYAHDAPEAGEPDHRGLSGARSRIDLEADATLSPDWRARATGHAFYDWAYRARNRDDFPDAFLDQYESEAEPDEVYVAGRVASDLDLRTGRQIVVWGKSDNIRVTDVLNPLDLRLPGRTDIAELRLPVAMTKLDYYIGDWNLSGIVVHEVRFNKTPVFGSDFFFLSQPAAPEDKPETSFANQEVGVALNGVFSGWDLSFHAAYTFDDQPHAEDTSRGRRRLHSRLRMAGAAANLALGNWLLKGEAAYVDGIEFLGLPGQSLSRLDVMAGAEYSGFADTTISVEAANRHLFGYDKALDTVLDDGRRNDFQTVLRVRREFLNDTVELSFLASTFGPTGANGAFQRLQLGYDWTDSIEVTAGVINYVSGDKRQFRKIGDNDRVFARIAYRF